MIELRGDITRKLTPAVMERIREAPKPTKTAEVVIVTREFKGMALSLEEIAEIMNISDPSRQRSRASDYEVRELEKHPELLVIKTPTATYVRYVGLRSLYKK